MITESVKQVDFIVTSFWLQFSHSKRDFWLKPTIPEKFYIFWEWDQQNFLQLSLTVSIHKRNDFTWLAIFSCSTLLNKSLSYYSQNHVKCSRPLCSLPGLQGQKFFADAIINFLIPFKSISDKNWYDQLFINEVVKIFTFHFDESVIKFYWVKVFQI